MLWIPSLSKVSATAALILSLCVGHVAASESGPKAPSRPFTTAELNTVLRLIEEAQKQISPEYYLSGAYLRDHILTPEVTARQRANHLKWEEIRKERERQRQIMLDTRDAERSRLRRMRDQEIAVKRAQRQAQIRLHRRQHCARLRQHLALRNAQRPAHLPLSSYRGHPSCL